MERADIPGKETWEVTERWEGMRRTCGGNRSPGWAEYRVYAVDWWAIMANHKKKKKQSRVTNSMAYSTRVRRSRENSYTITQGMCDHGPSEKMEFWGKTEHRMVKLQVKLSLKEVYSYEKRQRRETLRWRPKTSPWCERTRTFIKGFPGGSVARNLPTSAGDVGSIPHLGRSHVLWSN